MISFSQNNGSDYLSFSIVVAAKNEENNIEKLIDALKNLSYPEDKFEVIIVDDNSTDSTFERVEKSIKNNTNFYLIPVKEKELSAKKGALQIGIKKAKNPFIIITDADCIPQKNWLKFYSQKFSEGFDMLFGAAPFQWENKFVSKVSCFENLRCAILSFSAALLGLPYSAAARNFGFSKSAFQKIGGYENTTETLSGDDDLLIREAVKNNLKVGVIGDKEAFVFSKSKSNFKDYLKQKKRHTKTSFYYLPKQILFLSVWHLINLFFFFSPILIFLTPLFLILFFIKIFLDILIVNSFQGYLNYKFSIYEIIFFQFIYELFLVINFFNALFGKAEWK